VGFSAFAAEILPLFFVAGISAKMTISIFASQ
jgi:hypothetical protein